jgi:flagellar hook-associated protein 3 FlgL
MRITNRMLADRALAGLTAQMNAVAHAQDQTVSGKRIVTPSDDPASTRSAIRLRDAMAQTTQYLRNIDVASDKMSAAEAAFSVANDAMLRAKELAVQGATGSLSATDRASLAQEVEQLARSVVQQAAAKSGSDYVFSGFRTDQAPYAEAPAGSAVVSSYAGDGGQMLARVGPGVTVATNVTADVAFKPALDALAQLHADLLAGTPVQQTTLTQVDTGRDAVMSAWSDLGSRQNRMERTQQSLGDLQTTSTKMLSDLEDVDMAQAITDLTTRQTAYEAAIKTNAKILTTTLLDYLR